MNEEEEENRPNFSAKWRRRGAGGEREERDAPIDGSSQHQGHRGREDDCKTIEAKKSAHEETCQEETNLPPRDAAGKERSKEQG